MADELTQAPQVQNPSGGWGNDGFQASRILKVALVLVVVAIVAFATYSFSFSSGTPKQPTTTTSLTSITTTINPYAQGTLANLLTSNSTIGIGTLASYLNAKVSSVNLLNASYNSSLTMAQGAATPVKMGIRSNVQKYYSNLSNSYSRAGQNEVDVRNAAGAYYCTKSSGASYLCTQSFALDVLNESFNPISIIFMPGNKSISLSGKMSNIRGIKNNFNFMNSSCTLFNSSIVAISHINTPAIGDITNTFTGNLSECISSTYYVPLFATLSGNLRTLAKLGTGDMPQGNMSVYVTMNAISFGTNPSASVGTLPK